MRLLFLALFTLAIAGCVTEPEPINDGRTDGPISYPAHMRVGILGRWSPNPYDAAFYVSRSHNGFRKRDFSLGAGFDAEGYIVYPEVLTINGGRPPYQKRGVVEPGGIYLSEDTLLWGSDETIAIEIQNLMGRDLATDIQIAQPFKAEGAGRIDTINDERDLLIRYANTRGDSGCYWKLKSLSEGGINYVDEGEVFTDNGEIKIPSSVLSKVTDKTEIEVTLNRELLTDVDDRGQLIGVLSYYTETRYFFMDRTK